MHLNMTASQSKLAAIGLLLLLLLLVVVVIGIPTWKLHAHYDQAIVESTDKLQRYQRISGLKPEIDKAILETIQRGAGQYYLKGSTRTLAEAELQSLVTRLAETRNCRIISSQVLPVKEDPKLAEPGKVQVSIQMHASIVPLQMMIHSLETHKPYLFIENLTIRSTQGRAYKATPGVQPEFVVQITLSGYTAK